MFDVLCNFQYAFNSSDWVSHISNITKIRAFDASEATIERFWQVISANYDVNFFLGFHIMFYGHGGGIHWLEILIVCYLESQSTQECLTSIFLTSKGNSLFL